ncbi:MAG: ABC transporter permease [Micromonosporaceae bacterium]
MFRATLKSLLSRKTRLLLSGFAVVLGVMAVSGALIITETISASFSSLFQTVTAQVDVQVTGKENVDREGPASGAEPVPASVVDQVAGVPGVAEATGTVTAPAVRVIGPDGKALVTQGPPTFGVDWPGLAAMDELVEQRAGRAPEAANEVSLSANLATRAGVRVGDQIDLITLAPRQSYTVVGIFGYSGDRDTIAGESRVAFDTATAQRNLLGEDVTGFSTVNVTAEPGVSPEALKDRIAAELGDGVVVRTGDEVADELASTTGDFVELMRQVLLGFAAVALLVGIFLILNTFSMLVNQRTGELAVLRSLGASRSQIVGSVLLEAVVIGLLAATVGLGAGAGLGVLLKYLMETFTGAQLPVDGLIVPPLAIVAAYGVGVTVTVLAAVLPALRASRVAPIAAMRSSAVERRPVWLLSAAGGVLLAAAFAALLPAFFGPVPMWVLVGGVLAGFVGAALLALAITRPVVSQLGLAVAWRTPGELGRRNSARNPRRTAITATALMVGIALVTGVGVLASSLQASITTLVESELKADLVITGASGGGPDPGAPGGYDPAVLTAARSLDGVDAATALYTDAGQLGTEQVSLGAGSVPELAPMFSLTASHGTVRELRTGEIAVTSEFAGDHGIGVGDELTLATAKGGRQAYTLVLVYEAADLLPPALLSVADAQARFRSAQPTGGYLTVADGASVTAVRDQVGELLADNPDYSVADQADYAAQQASQVDTFLVMLYILTGLALVIAVLGIVNTLALSIVERTRELGLLRAVGLLRRQVTWMVTAESVVIAVFGALLGVAVGAGLGVASALALRDQGLEVLAMPWTEMGIFLAGAVLIGLLAAVLPSIRAARVDVLRAIAYE